MTALNMGGVCVSPSASGTGENGVGAGHQDARDYHPPSLELDRNLIRIHEV